VFATRNAKRISERRDTERLPFDSPVLLRNGSGSRIEANLSDISTHGCAIVTGGVQLVKDGVYSVKMAGFELLVGKVLWAKGRYAGMQFFEPLHDATVAHLAAKAPVTATMEAG